VAAAGASTRRARAASEPIRFGWPVALTGANSAVGNGYKRGVTYAVDKINGGGGVNGRMIEVVARDTQGDPSKAVNAAMEMSSNARVHAIFGPVNSGEALATTPIFTRFKVPSLACGVVDSLIDPVKYPYAFRMAPYLTQWDLANCHYCVDILKAKKIALIGDNTGYGTMAIAAAAENFKKAGAEVVYSATVDADAQDFTPNLLRARDAGAQVVAEWSNSTGLASRLMNARGRMGWDVPLSGNPAMGSGDVARLLEKPEYWNKVYVVGHKCCAFDANGRLPPRTQAFLDEVKGKVQLSDLTLYWVLMAYDAVYLVADAVAKTGSSDADAIVGYWSHVTNWPGVYGDYTCTPEQHNGYPTEEVVMLEANSSRDGAMKLAPGYA
jgi:branched-chain amino acid transport system substrate-binding protein